MLEQLQEFLDCLVVHLFLVQLIRSCLHLIRIIITIKHKFISIVCSIYRLNLRINLIFLISISTYPPLTLIFMFRMPMKLLMLWCTIEYFPTQTTTFLSKLLTNYTFLFYFLWWDFFICWDYW